MTRITEEQARQHRELRNILYRSSPNGRDYSFTFSLVGGGWRIHINNSPDYEDRDSGSVATHRIDIATRPYVCWAPDGRNMAPIESLEQAQSVAALWADCTENYILTGRFEPPPNRPPVEDRSVLNGFPPTGVVQAPRHYPLAPAPRRNPVTPAPANRDARWDALRNRLFI